VEVVHGGCPRQQLVTTEALGSHAGSTSLEGPSAAGGRPPPPVLPRLARARWRSRLTADGSRLGTRLAPRQERVLEHVIRHAPALGDPLGLVERPVNAEVNTTLTVFFLGLGK
jgi:hypothetical protein